MFLKVTEDTDLVHTYYRGTFSNISGSDDMYSASTQNPGSFLGTGKPENTGCPPTFDSDDGQRQVSINYLHRHHQPDVTSHLLVVDRFLLLSTVAPS